jgi:long-chain acyl-CoA synthetase
MCDFAIWMAGHVSVPLYPTLAAGTIRQILEHREAKLLFVGKLDGWDAMAPASRTACRASRCRCRRRRRTRAGRRSRRRAAAGESPVRAADELGTIMYTSGTTGQPKGVMHSFGTFAWSMQAALKRVPLRADARILSYLPLAHVAERTLVEHALLATGMQVFFAESLETFTADLQRARPTVFFSVPRLWVKFQQAVNAKMPPPSSTAAEAADHRRRSSGARSSARSASTSASSPPAAPRRCRRSCWPGTRARLPIIEVYGMTENCGVSHATLPGVQRPGTVGKAYDGVQSRLDPANGEIQVKSPGLMLGYYKEPELSRQALTADGWLHTGDKGELDPEGNLRITGRVKDLFKTSKASTLRRLRSRTGW